MIYNDYLPTFCWIIIIQVTFSIQLFSASISAGTCWFMDENTGKCDLVVHSRQSREECCSTAGLLTAWSHHSNVTFGQLFQWRITGGPPQCSSCLTSCKGIHCPTGKQCRIRQGHPKCVCARRCSSSKDGQTGPVCGSDGKSYKNKCNLLRYNCKHRTHLEVEYHGKCQRSCKKVVCRDHHHCLEDQHNIPHCVYCSTTCPSQTHPSQQMCGGNGITYRSACHLQVETCLHGKAIGIAYEGPCQERMTCSELLCKRGWRCLVSSVTQYPSCVHCQRSCSAAIHPSVPVCGSDNKTYSSYCHLRHVSCKTGILLTTLHSGRCEDTRSIEITSW